MVIFAPIPQLQLRLHPRLFGLSFILFVVGDCLTTALALQIGAVEQHPLSALILSVGGVFGMVLWKIAVFGAIRSIGFFVFDEWEIGLSLGLIVTGVSITIWNASIIARMLVF